MYNGASKKPKRDVISAYIFLGYFQMAMYVPEYFIVSKILEERLILRKIDELLKLGNPMYL